MFIETKDIEKNYLLSTGKYIHFHDCDDGIDYTLFDNNGNEIDGGILEYDFKSDWSIRKILMALSDFLDMPGLLDTNKEEIDSCIIDEFQDKLYKI